MVKMSTIILSVVVATVIFTGLVTMSVDTATRNNLVPDDSYVQSYTQINSTIAVIQGNISSSLDDTVARGADTQNTLTDAPKAALEAIVLMKNFPNLVFGSLSLFSRDLGLPIWFVPGAIAALTIIVLFAVVSALRGKDI